MSRAYDSAAAAFRDLDMGTQNAELAASVAQLAGACLDLSAATVATGAREADRSAVRSLIRDCTAKLPPCRPAEW